MTIVDRIKIKLELKKISIKAFEKEIGLGNGTIAKWDTQIPRIDKLIAVANSLHVSLDWLVFGKETNELTSEEQELLEAYRNANPGMQAAARKLLDAPEPTGKLSEWMTEEEAI